jgi:hypothetical protein
MPSWPLKIITEQCNAELKKELDLLIENNQIVWHGLPFTSHTDFCSAEEYIEGLRYARELSDKYHKPYPISAKMTDVPGHGIMLPAILRGAGIQFLHLGCNEFANPPKLPFLFHWQAVSGERVLTMYNKGGYGTPLLPPEDWDYPVWMALIQTHDNCGPQSASVIEKLIKNVHKKYPDAEVVCGTMDEFYKDLAQYDLSSLPVVTKDLADTWIHGIGAYPKETGILRAGRERSKRLQALITKKVLEGSEPIGDGAMEVLDRYYENVCLFEEHTWGADVKTWLGPDRVYRKKDFLKAKQKKNYQFMEASWQEQKDRAIKCDQAVNELKLLVESKDNMEYSLFNPNSRAFSGWVSLKDLQIDFEKCSLEVENKILPITKTEDEYSCYVSNLQPFQTIPIRVAEEVAPIGKLIISHEKEFVKAQNHRYIMTFSSITGNITEIFDKQLNSILLKQHNQKSIFSYQYDRYGIEDITTYLKDYAYRYTTWGIQDYGREAYPECKHKTFYPKFKSYLIENDTISFHYDGAESVERYGDAERITIEVTLPPVGDELFVNLKLTNKRETPYIESGAFLFPFADEKQNYRINKSNVVLDPAKDIQEDANHVFYCLENYISSAGEKSGVCIITKDTPLVSLGNTGIYKYRKDYVTPEEPVAYFNLFNNMWGTNFPQWISGDLNYSYVLFGFEKAQEDLVMERAVALQEGIEITRNRLDKEIAKFPEHMQLINARIVNNGLIIRFKDVLGEIACRKLQVENFTITPIDLHNKPSGESVFQEYDFMVKPYGVYSFLLSK